MRIPVRKHTRIRAVLRRMRHRIAAAQEQSPPSRRSVLTAVLRLALVIGAVAVPSQHLSAARRPSRDRTHVARTVAAVIDHMLPGGDLPGARALGIDRSIAALSDHDLQRSFARGVGWLDTQARGASIGGADFLALDAAGREAVLQAAFATGADVAGSFVRELRSLALTRYYTHPTVIAAFAHTRPPQPAGFPDFQEAPR